ncbi:MAG: tetratricopeptide repeat protein, partial [Candidatus Eiseniibacteriota bacterium]
QYAVWRLVDTRTGRSLAARRVDGRDMAELANLMIAEVLPLVSREYGIEETPVAQSVTTITTASTEAYKHFVAGILAREEWQHQNAVPRFEQALEYDSTFALALFKLSQAHFESGTRGEVVNDYADKAWELRTRLGIKDGLLLKAWRERLNLRPRDALSTYQAMLARWPDDREVLGALAQLLFYFWYFDEAGEVARRALSLYPDDVIITSVGWSSLVYLGHMEEALASIRAFIARNPTKVNGLEELGRRYLEMGQADSAEVAFRQVLEIDSSNFWAQWGIGNCHYQRGDLNRALETFEHILSRSDLLSGQRVDLMTNLRQSICLSWIHAAAGRFGKALDVFEEAQQLVSDPEYDARVERNRAWLLLRMRRAEEVLLAARALAERDVGRYALAKALENSARALVRLDSLESARRTLQEYLDAAEEWRGSSEYTSHKVSAEIALAEGNAKRALGYLEEMKLYGAPYFQGLLGIEYREDLAHAYRLAGRLDEAAEVLKELLRIHGGHALAHYQLGQILEEMGRTAEAEKEYSTFLRAWADADEGLPQLEYARARLAALRAGS